MAEALKLIKDIAQAASSDFGIRFAEFLDDDGNTSIVAHSVHINRQVTFTVPAPPKATVSRIDEHMKRQEFVVDELDVTTIWREIEWLCGRQPRAAEKGDAQCTS